ncbi:MAG: hypothetical protein HY660_10645 [Armatimonadetes bacterium]|nr:hypothetical protein [Armatimonadota bacterium]
MWTVRALLGLSLAAAAALSWGGPAASGPAQRPVVILQGVDVATLDPQYSSSLPDVNVIIHIFERLMWFDNSVKLVPQLAESWRLVDPLTWEFAVSAGRRSTTASR